ncbi:MAG: SURF1 family protein [Chromatiales bacterium]|nr:SURF1 family protein [Chromatiales bacterium]
MADAGDAGAAAGPDRSRSLAVSTARPRSSVCRPNTTSVSATCAVRLDGTLQDAGLLRFRRVLAHGRYEPGYQILIDNRVHQGRAGYHVLTPLRLGISDMRVLVNRGWVPVGAGPRAAALGPSPDGEIEVAGIAAVPVTGGFRLGARTCRHRAGRNCGSTSTSRPMRPACRFRCSRWWCCSTRTGPAGGYTRAGGRGSTVVSPPTRAMPFQWFSLAVALVAIYILVNTRRSEDAVNGSDRG